MLDQIQNGQIEDWIWQKILEKMYEEHDDKSLTDQIREVVANYGN